MTTGATTESIVVPQTPSLTTATATRVIVKSLTSPEALLTSADFRRKFTIDDLIRLYELGFLDDDDDCYELIDGDLIPIARIKGPHSACVNRLTLWLPDRLGKRGNCIVQNPIYISETSQPQPDFAIAHREEDGYPGIPRASDLFLAIEVMDSSGPLDRKIKLPLYASAGIPETWLIDIPSLLIERHRNPVDGAYSERVILRSRQFIAPEAFPDIILSVSRIFGLPASESES